jgi:hypothetical protein
VRSQRRITHPRRKRNWWAPSSPTRVRDARITVPTIRCHLASSTLKSSDEWQNRIDLFVREHQIVRELLCVLSFARCQDAANLLHFVLRWDEDVWAGKTARVERPVGRDGGRGDGLAKEGGEGGERELGRCMGKSKSEVD